MTYPAEQGQTRGPQWIALRPGRQWGRSHGSPNAAHLLSAMGPYDGLSTPWWESCVTATGRVPLQQSGTEPVSRYYGATLVRRDQHLERMNVLGSLGSEPIIVIFCRVEAMIHSVGNDGMRPRRVTRSPAAGRDGSDQRIPCILYLVSYFTFKRLRTP